MQEERIIPHRWLWPFTRSLDLPAIEVALHLADRGRATLIVVSLVTAPHAPYIRDRSLDILRTRAQQLAVPLECYEESTRDAPGRIPAMTREWHCDGILLGSEKGHALFLTDNELRLLLTCPPTSLVLVRLSRKTPSQTHDQRKERRGARLPWRKLLAQQADGLLTTVSPTTHTEISQAERVTRTE